MEGDNNVIYGAFGADGLGEVSLGSPVSPQSSATSETNPAPAGEQVGVQTLQDLQAQLSRLTSQLRDAAARIASPEVDPETFGQLMDQLKDLQQLSHKAARGLTEAEGSDEGYISAQKDLMALGSQVEQFVGQVDQHTPQAPPPAPAVAPVATRRPFPWIPLGIGLLSVTGLVWLISKKGNPWDRNA